jgi:hypothetical protein
VKVLAHGDECAPLVILGFIPRIHGNRCVMASMDCRDKPGNDIGETLRTCMGKMHRNGRQAQEAGKLKDKPWKHGTGRNCH